MKKLLVVIALTLTLGIAGGLYATPASAFYCGPVYCCAPMCYAPCWYGCCPKYFCGPAKVWKGSKGTKGKVEKKDKKK
jgi:hypothetical protein